MRKLKKVALAAVATAAIAAPLAVTAAPAHAAVNPGCATRAEFSRIHHGQTVRTTQRIIGSKGRVSMAGSFLSQRQWHVCGSSFSWVTLTYLNGRLDNKIML
jgi:hypothetical protein